MMDMDVRRIGIAATLAGFCIALVAGCPPTTPEPYDPKPGVYPIEQPYRIYSSVTPLSDAQSVRGLVEGEKGRVVLLCWQYGEKSIGFWHAIDEGFGGRRALATVAAPQLQ